MAGLDTASVTDDRGLSESIRECYPFAQHFTFTVCPDRELFVSMAAATLQISAWCDDHSAVIVLGNVALPQSVLRAVIDPSLTVDHIDASRLAGAQWLVVVHDGKVRVQGTPTGLTRVYWARRGAGVCRL